eukprot:TRINITY_DN11687_c0_g1_i1.p1 TRINITY_DN11687_c0_g1~~TRINITY_DN11687_c0_g1_i1.p1  ORF type:complete len:425 (-),score=48.40 TRINITY_DN11687_c0_g1_i1:107-1381(-)
MIGMWMRGLCHHHVLFVLAAVVGFGAPAEALDNGVARLPPMGWTTWCTDNGIIPCYNDFCNETEVKSVADAMVANGMRDLGYTYLNLDDCWAGPRLANGSVTADKSRFPSGSLQPLADYLHDRGLLLGVYTDVGEKTCRGDRPGSWGYYEQDAATYAGWGVDLVKMDWCDHPSGFTAEQLYGMMRDALNATGRPMLFSICEWGLEEPWTWGAQTGNTWRVGPDKLPVWWTPKTSQTPGQGQGTANIIQHMAGLSQYSAPGGWNDPDYIEIGEWTEGFGKFSQMDYQTQFSFWCLWNAPLYVATDVRDLSDKQQIMNKEAIAINQDPMGVAGDRVSKNNVTGAEVWSKPLSNERWATVLYNSNLVPGLRPCNVTVTFNALPGWPSSSNSATLRDVWAHASLGTFAGSFSAHLEPHASMMLVLSPR